MASAVQRSLQANPQSGSQVRSVHAGGVLTAGLLLTFALCAPLFILGTLAAIRSMVATHVPQEAPGIELSLGLQALPRVASKDRIVHPGKFSRLTVTPVDPRRNSLTALLIRSSYDKKIAAATQHALQLAAAQEQKLALEQTAALEEAPSLERTGSIPVAVAAGSTAPNSAIVTALGESAISLPQQTAARRFDLILTDEAQAQMHALPDSGPLPLGRPAGFATKTTEKPATRHREPLRELAYARPDNPLSDDGTDDSFTRMPDAGNRDAIYDISAGLVYLPSGERLEAHSGLGPMRDNPKSVKTRMRGATPPHTYRLTMREALFHGVEAIRLTPIDGINPHGRDGFLAHTYMLGPSGNSNGCVVFKDYRRFLNAFKRGQVNRMIVVPNLPASRRLASLWSSRG